MPDINFSITYDLLKKNKNNSDQRIFISLLRIYQYRVTHS